MIGKIIAKKSEKYKVLLKNTKFYVAHTPCKTFFDITCANISKA